MTFIKQKNMTQKFEKLRSKITTYKRRLIVFLAHLSRPNRGDNLKLPKILEKN